MYVLPNKVAPITATAATVKSILTRLFMEVITYSQYIIIPILYQQSNIQESYNLKAIRDAADARAGMIRRSMLRQI